MRACLAGKSVVVVALTVVGVLASLSPSRAEMIDTNATSSAIQSAVQSARQKSQKSAPSAPAESRAPAKQIQSAKKDTSGDKKPKAGTPAAGRSSNLPPAGERQYVPDEIVLEVAAATSDQQVNILAQRFRLQALDSFNFQLGNSRVVRVRVLGGRPIPAVVRALQGDAAILFAQPNYLFGLVEEKPAAAAGGEADQYLLEKMHLAEAHRLSRGDKVLVAVIDSGVDVSHPDLAGDIADSFDAIGIGEPVHPHGTAIAGGIAAHGRLTGAAPAAQILAVRAFSGSAHSEQGTTYAIIKGLDWAVSHGARVINMSFAGPQDPGLARGLSAAHGKGVVLVAAAGNKGASSPPLYPAADRNVITVTSTDKNDELPSFANRGPYVAVAAPGVDLTLLAPNDSLQHLSGTSFSAAFVSGTVALMLERKPGLAPDAVRQALMASARHLSGKPVDDQSGGGLVDAYQAILAVAPEMSSATSAPTVGHP